ncbi:hypothetical protein G3T14_11255 [Methylobacterium sp. BTF04]|uniref:hypothetical protein n=1 Tax=Methylobacterium sp. BTF04 TaxID=2708300 RepID=UPI0013D6F2EE|nr:hypothetical protein [Methylobacterium sp. BTF04]NEU12712.1 hypothetical protein [Methylobacterium sp. BTF04]
MPPLDLPRLRRDVKRRQDARPQGQGPGGRLVTGSMAIVREHLEAFEAMHRDGASWVDIAAALAAQEVMQGTGDAAQPITARRLTALMASVRRERERHAQAGRARMRRSDLGLVAHVETCEPAAPSPLSISTPSTRSIRERKTLSLAPELTQRETLDTELDFPSAEDIRRSALATVQKLLKKDPP